MLPLMRVTFIMCRLVFEYRKIQVKNVRKLSTFLNRSVVEKADLPCNSQVLSKHKTEPVIRLVIVCQFSSKSNLDNNDDKPGRYCYHKDVEKAVNKQILKEFNAGYAYLSMACYFGRSDIALPGCQGFFMRMHEEEHGHALKLIDYQLLRGAAVHLYPLTVSECQDWEGIEKALAVSLDMEKLIKEHLVVLCQFAAQHNDSHLAEMLEGDFLPHQDDSICEIARLLKRIQTMGNSGVAEFLFDKQLFRVYVKGAAKKGIHIDLSNTHFYK